ncbi:MAG: hypothetical protein IJU76_15015 [Desulfovibrionaceae bacterium]|nr:hypothetical protein [Desulfovibrionaceae bacterium]
MDMSLYDFITLLIVVPLLFFKFTVIPEWIFTRVRQMNLTVVIVLSAILLTAIAARIATSFDEGFTVRFVAFAIAVLACIIHYLYTKDKKAE